MGLEDKVIVRPEDVKKLYQRAPDKYVKPIEELGFLPLTVKDLCTEEGQALLHFASWVYFSGNLKTGKYKPFIYGKNVPFETLKNEKFAALKQEFKIEDDNPTGDRLKLIKNSGIFGRLLYAMGILLPEGTRQHSYSKNLSHFINDIMDSKPAEDEVEERKNLLTIIASVLFKDRLKKTSDEWGKDHYHLGLKHFETEDDAIVYGRQIVDFLNCVFERGNQQKVFHYNAISTANKKKRGLVEGMLRLSDQNIGYLITKAPHLLKPLQVDY